MFETFSAGLKTFIDIAQVVTILYAVYRFSRKPQDTLAEKLEALEKRVDEHDVKIKEVTESLHQGNDRFRDQSTDIRKLKTTFKSVVLAFINFEIAYCTDTKYEHIEELRKAKAEIEKYLTDREE